jgi:predicted XRE-type DNA-binding protein
MGDSRISEEVDLGRRDSQTGRRRDQAKNRPITAASGLSDGPLEVVDGSDNIYRDFECSDADLREAKARLGVEIMRILENERLSTRQAEARSGVSHSEFSRIRSAKFRRFTLDRLVTIIGRMGYEVDLAVGVRPRAAKADAVRHNLNDLGITQADVTAAVGAARRPS